MNSTDASGSTLLCSECHMPFPAQLFYGQYPDIRMCFECKLKNPEITSYLYLYEYGPKWANNWTPFDVRVKKLEQKIETLELELKEYKKTYSKDDTKAERETLKKLEGLLEQCKKELSTEKSKQEKNEKKANAKTKAKKGKK